MNDKEMIEEMAKVICSCASPCNLEDWDDCDKMANCPKVIKIAKELHLANYRKIPEGAMVLTKEDIEGEIDCAKVVMLRYDESGTKCVSYDAYKEYTDRLGENIKKLKAKIKILECQLAQARKEPAREFFEKAKEKCKELENKYSHLCKSKKECLMETCRYEGVIAVKREIYELAKQFGVKIEE